MSLLGSTGSIGTQALDVIRRNRERFSVKALAAAGTRLDELVQQILEFSPEYVAIAANDPSVLAQKLRDHGCRRLPQILEGNSGVSQVAGLGVDVVLNGMTGSIGLEPTLAALKAGSMLALANKESLIVGGELVTRAASVGQIVPVDSEHSALAQALRAASPDEVSRLIVTASGGPFRGMSAQDLERVTPEQALAHPTWDMGRVVTTNSASMVNKALEVIEAHFLFDIALERIDVCVHPQSMIHSMVEFIDGCTMAQVSPPDMRLPIALGLAWPHRLAGAIAPEPFTEPSSWTFEPLDENVFTAVRTAKEARINSGTHLAVFNAANEEGVEAFHECKISFPRILAIVEDVLAAHDGVQEPSLEDVLEAERWARAFAQKKILEMSPHQGRGV